MEKLESHITYLAGSHVLRSWPGLQLTLLKFNTIPIPAKVYFYICIEIV
jgi:hypothetical protein